MEYTYNKIVKLLPEQLFWDFDAEPPYYKLEGTSPYSSTVKVDPFPCASHDIDLFTKEVERVEKAFKVGSIVRYFIMPNESIGRTNATARREEIWNSDELKEKFIFETKIVFSGKRTIVHPAITKYLVAHEYGHAVDHWITAKMNMENKEKGIKSNDSVFMEYYAKKRGIEMINDYGGGRWENNIKEIIADDFRIVVAKVDKDFFPHKKFRHPLYSDKVTNIWKDLKKQYSVK